MPASTLPTRSQALDDLIMGTNSSSIVSKRSVERLYHPDEPHYFRYFVKKPQRRAPLINRGYWLRLKAIDVVVRQFLSRSSPNKKVVINLGCGSDVLPWQCHARYADASKGAFFVDIDYPDLMHKKREIVLGTPQLRELLGPDLTLSESDKDPVLIKSPAYCQVACDLRELETLRTTLASLVPLSESEVLFVAEVSVTYMDTLSSDAVIEWASSIGKAEFCLLEQIIPQGPDHPFAKTMLKHFEKLNTPLKSVREYPTLDSQRVRFQSRGWEQVDLWDLWEAWAGDYFLSSAERSALDDVEPFDEWEELMLFGRHYFVMHARATRTPGASGSIKEETSSYVPTLGMDMVPTTHSKPIRRRFGNAFVGSTVEGEQFGYHLFGLGSDSRSDTYDLYALRKTTSPHKLPLRGPPPRMCSTLTDLGEYGVLLVGGRSSPGKAFSDCWLLSKMSQPSWTRTWDLPVPLYRHCATRLKGSSLSLIIGGRTGASGVSQDNFVFHPEKGWLKCRISGVPPEPVFGAVTCNSLDRCAPKTFNGFLCGGMLRDGTINSKKYAWQLDMSGVEPSISFEVIYMEGPEQDFLSVFGAEAIDLGSGTAVCGGIGEHESQQGQIIVFISPSKTRRDHVDLTCVRPHPAESPLMVGSSTVLKDKTLTVLGGGATCFSMGTYWETKSYQLDLSGLWGRDHSISMDNFFQYLESPRILAKVGDEDTPAASSKRASIAKMPRVTLRSREHFEELLRDGKPVIIQELDLGPCLESWTAEYMAERVGREKEVIVHECQGDTEKMDFNSKNFQYVTDSFGNVLSRIQAGGRLYLRSLSHAKPSEAPANIDEDFPGIAQDFCLPEGLEFVRRNLFSSILRISGRVNMWLHYDVMANVYAQIKGSKRMVLFPPSDVSHLSFAPGSSSSSLDVFASLDSPVLSPTHPHEAMLEPGDLLLLPPMWLHTATPTSDMSVAVNVFFRNLDGVYSTGRDVYGNRDLAAYEKGRQDTARIGKSFEKLPREIRMFYLSRIADELRAAAEGS